MNQVSALARSETRKKVRELPDTRLLACTKPPFYHFEASKTMGRRPDSPYKYARNQFTLHR
jgi:hypothetical protein